MQKTRIAVVGLGSGANRVRMAGGMDDVQVAAVADNAPCPARLDGKSLEEFAAETGAKAYTDGALGAAYLLGGDLVIAWRPPPGHWVWDPENGNGYINEGSVHLLDTVWLLVGAPI